MLNPTDSLFMTPAASARVMANLYSVVLLATLVLAVSAIAGWCVRRSGAEARGLVCRSAVVALLVVFVGREVPLHWVAWVVPSVLAEPLVALGRVQVTAPAIHGVPVAIDARDVAALTPLGLGAALAVRLGIAVRPEEYSWVQMIGAGALAGVGFTMSLYIAHKAFPDESDFAAAKVGIFLASLIAGGLGTTLLWRAAASDLGKSNQTTSISKGR